MYNTNIEAIPSDISDDEGNERGMITETFTISFTLSCEFNTMAAFYLTLRDDSDKFMAYVNFRGGHFNSNKYCLYSGGGIVSDSVAELEWEETNAKISSLKQIIDNFSK